MTKPRRLAAAFLALSVVMGPVAACGDDEGEDQIGDEEIIDEGD